MSWQAAVRNGDYRLAVCRGVVVLVDKALVNVEAAIERIVAMLAAEQVRADAGEELSPAVVDRVRPGAAAGDIGRGRPGAS